MGNKKVSKAEKRKRTVRLVQAVIALLLVLGMVIAGIVSSFGN